MSLSFIHRSIRFHRMLPVVTTMMLSGFAVRGDRVLFNPAQSGKLTSIPQRDVTLLKANADGQAVLRMAAGHQQRWPGITLSAPPGGWDLSSNDYVSVEVRNAGKSEVTVGCRVDDGERTGVPCSFSSDKQLAPGTGGGVRVQLRKGGDSLGGRLFGMRGYPSATPHSATNPDATNITAITLFVLRPTEDSVVEFGKVEAGGMYVAPTASIADAAPFFPFIDTFGQYSHRDWPGKIHSVAELVNQRRDEAAALAQNPGPSGWDRFGGWADGPVEEATGFFHTAKFKGKWWLVAPDGHLFFSQGIDCVGAQKNTPIDERQEWFEAFPGNEPGFSSCFSTAEPLKGHYAGRRVKCFSFAQAGLLRKYGPDWRKLSAQIDQKRLRSWGINTLGNWSDVTPRALDLAPYTSTIYSHGARLLEGSSGYWSKFPDVFDPSFAETLKQCMARDAGPERAGDPWCIGFFCDNEMSWGSATSLALATIESPADQPAKKQFVSDLEGKYGTIDKLNSAWGTHYAGWPALLSSQSAPDPACVQADLTDFSRRIAETYFRTVRDTIEAVAPHQLYLGCRFAAVNDVAAAAAAKYCDVVSYNLYRREVEDFHFPAGDKPLLVGEFHFGALDRGLFHPGLVPVENQAERALAYREYVLGALRNQLIVGTHWFECQDEPTIGRSYDEENFQIGFVDVADTPYPEMVAASRQAAAQMYQTRLGN